MADIIAFPNLKKNDVSSPSKCIRIEKPNIMLQAVLSLLTFIQFILLSLWPLLRWLVYLDLLIMGLKILVKLNATTLGLFALHSCVILMVVWFVFFCRFKKPHSV